MYSRCGCLFEARKLFDEMHSQLTVVSWNSLIMGYVDEGDGATALKLFSDMHQEGCRPDHRTFVAAVKACIRERDGGDRRRSLQRGMAIQAQASECGLEKDVFLASALVELYARYGKVTEARRVFDSVKKPDVVLWTALITAYNENGQGEVALDLFRLMQDHGYFPDVRTFLAAAKACSSLATTESGVEVGNNVVKLAALEKGMAVHSQAANSGCVSDGYLATTLVDMYGRVGSLVDARRVFDRMSQHNVVAWNVLLLGYLENGDLELCVELLSFMSVEPDAWTYATTGKACAGLAKREQGNERVVYIGWLSKGLDMHSRAARAGHDSDVFVASSLINMYSNYGCLVDARTVFDRLAHHNVVVWNALLLGLAEYGEPELALQLFGCMSPRKDSCTFIAALKACSSLAGREEPTVVDGKLLKARSLEKGKDVLSECVQLGLHSSITFRNSLMDMYVKTGSMVDARRTFESLPCHNLVSWNTLTSGYAEHNEEELALETFERMQGTGCVPDARSYVAAVKACSSLASKGNSHAQSVWVRKVAEIHAQASERNLDSESFLSNSLMDFYVKSGNLDAARVLFDRMKHRSVVSWTILLLGYAQSPEEHKALKLLRSMLQEGYKLNSPALAGALKACSSLAVKEKSSDTSPVQSLARGKALHSLAAEGGLAMDTSVCSSLLDMYCKCGSMADAKAVFDTVSGGKRGRVLWSSMIHGYAECGECERALEMYSCMRAQGCVPDAGAFAAVLKASGSVSALERAKSVHCDICKLGLEADVTLQTSLVDVYGKCGKVADAQHVFESVPVVDTPTRNALLAGYSRGGESGRVLEEFARMVEEGLKPDEVTFTCFLVACSHGGLPAEGRRCLGEMYEKFGVKPSKEHYVCLVDMLGRGSQVEEAFNAVEKMPFLPNDVAWRSVLGSCQKVCNLEAGRLAFESLVEANRTDAASYVLIANTS